jgi:hypothetical protein
MSAEQGTIDVIATTISGSLQDQRKVGRIGPEMQARTARTVRVHLAHSHAEARAAARSIVLAGGRTLVSAGGSGTLNAVLEGAHLGDSIPDDVRLAFLRKGSADLIGKVLGVPDDLPGAIAAVIGGIEADRLLEADVLHVAAIEPDGRRQDRHLVGFAGFGVFGEVPRFTESRVVKLYKGLLGSALGDMGPFLTGMVLAMVWWQILKRCGRLPALALTLDDERFGPEIWGSVMVLNGDLGADFPLGRSLALGSGSFRTVALHDRGLAMARRQIGAGRSGALLEGPSRYAAIVRDGRRLEACPDSPRPYMVNVDGLRLLTRGSVGISVSGRVRLVRGS